ncbi:putative apyrase 6 [Zea mays]|uniref:Putative apyrase 6 n=1 Tax=Zea mays TaxID=4577 RepID=A0A317Y2Y6_MAIZE|nr:putative apyrase 6 [Zea mays]
MSTFSSDSSNSCTLCDSSLDLRSLHHYLISCLLENNFAISICRVLEKSILIGQMRIFHGIASRWHTLWLYCMTVLVYHWMTRGKHIQIEYSNQVGDIQVEWALGAFITLMQNTSLKPLHTTAESTHSNRPLFAVLGMFLLCGVLFVSRWRKPKTKIIYDLEKGRYIITRIS